jgi:hypothetical protein
MSYCVSCGVELNPSEKACPLCGLEVLNPLKPYDDKAIRPYPHRLDPINAQINRGFTAFILSVCIAFPGAICLLVNLILNNRLSWSLYAAGALVMLWIFIVPWFLYRKPDFMKLMLPDIGAILLYLLLIARMQVSENWYVTLAMPLVLLASGLVIVNGLLIISGVFHGFFIPAAVLISIGLLGMGVELIVEMHAKLVVHLDWSYLVMAPCLAVALVCLAVARRQAIREEIKKRLHL